MSHFYTHRAHFVVFYNAMRNTVWEKWEPMAQFITRKQKAIADYEEDHPLTLEAYIAEYMRTFLACQPDMHRRLALRLRVPGHRESRERFIACVRSQVQLDFLARFPSQ